MEQVDRDPQQTLGMELVPLRLAILSMVVAGWVYHHQLIVIEFAKAEHRMRKGRPCRKRDWRIPAASDFFSVEAWTPRGLVTYEVLSVIRVADRVVHLAGIANRPDEAWMLWSGRNLLDGAEGTLAGTRYLIIDRETK